MVDTHAMESRQFYLMWERFNSCKMDLVSGGEWEGGNTLTVSWFATIN